MQELEERTDGLWRPSPGSVYPALQQLEDEGLIRSEEAEGRRLYHLTDAGRAYVAERPDDQPAPWETFTDNVSDQHGETAALMRDVAMAFAQVHARGQRGAARRGVQGPRRDAPLALPDPRRGRARRGGRRVSEAAANANDGAAGSGRAPAGGLGPRPRQALRRGRGRQRHRLRRDRGRDLRLPRSQRRGQVARRSACSARWCARRAATRRVAGHDVATERDEVRRNIGLVFQDTTLDGYLTAEQNLRLHAELYGVPRAVVPDRMRQVLEMVGLWDRRGSRVQTFSGGMKRRLEIARGLLHSPRVLFLDEPTVGLDPQTRSSIWRYIRELKAREDITIFLTTHYMDEAEYCDRIAIMDRGKIIVLDTPEALKASVGRDRVMIGTDDDDAAIAALRERFGLEATDPRGPRDDRGRERRRVRPAPVRRARRADQVGERVAAVARRRLHVVHGHDDPRRRGDLQRSQPPASRG